MTQPFISTDDLADLVGEDLATSDLAIMAIDSACEIVRGYLDNQVNLEETSIMLDGRGQPRLVLPRPPVRSITTVLEDDVELVEGTDFLLEAGGILRRIDESGTIAWARGYAIVEITYEHGWDITEPDDPEYAPEDFERVPADIRRVALGLAQRFFESTSGSSTGGVISETIGGGDYSYRLSETALANATAKGLVADEKMILERYRAPVS